MTCTTVPQYHSTTVPDVIDTVEWEDLEQRTAEREAGALDGASR